MVKTLFHVTTLIGTMVLSKISQGLVMGGSNPDSEQEMLDAWGDRRGWEPLLSEQKRRVVRQV